MRSEKKEAPLVSVVMPVYNAEKYLAAAIESILTQSFRDFELVMVDDASTDGSPAIIARYARKDPRIVVLKHKVNSMISRTLNTGIARARGKYILRMDADDVSLPGRLQKQVDYMEAHSEVGVSGTAMLLMNEAGKRFSRRGYQAEDAAIRKRLFRYSPFSHPTIILRKSILDQVGLYNPEYDFAEDYELYFRIGRIAKFGNLADELLAYRVVRKSITGRVTRRMERKTLAIRRLAVREYGYWMTLGDRVYWWLQYLSIYCVPTGLKNRLFTWLRSKG